jgi:predicted amidophosphoribosyltransferase
VYWCTKRNFDANQKSKEYVETFKKFETYKKKGLISGMYKMKHTFKDVCLDEVFYLDFYSIEVFGKTKLGQMMLYAKQSQSKKLIKEIVDIIKPKIQKLILDEKIDAVGFIPPTIKREVQFIKEIERGLDLKLFKINLSKIKGEYLVPQKTLSKLEDRIENAKQIKLLATFWKEEDAAPDFKKVLLIDDALGSGATLNEVARQIKFMNLSKEVIGLAITGSFSGFEIISEV